jgi:hypothetical protein
MPVEYSAALRALAPAAMDAHFRSVDLELLRIQVEREEIEIGRMLGLWQHEWGGAVLYFGPDNQLLGLGQPAEIGATGKILIPAWETL